MAYDTPVATRDAILACLEPGPLRLYEISAITGLCRTLCRYHLDNLRALGLIHPTGTTRCTRWMISESPVAPVDAEAYGVLREVQGDGSVVVRFGNQWRAGRAQLQRTPGKLSACSLVNMFA